MPDYRSNVEPVSVLSQDARKRQSSSSSSRTSSKHSGRDRGSKSSRSKHQAPPGFPRPRGFVFDRKMGVQETIMWRANRKAALARFRQKKAARIANPELCRYKIRKNIANKRPRVKGRFVKTTSLVDAEAAKPDAKKSSSKASKVAPVIAVKVQPR